jgi:hypothetical protein
MARKPSRARTPADAPVGLAALLEPHLDGLGEAAAARAERERAERVRAEREAALATRRRLDEAELMALIFDHLDPDNLRVCKGIEFERLSILSEPPPTPAPDPTPAPAPDPSPAFIPASSPEQPTPTPTLDPQVWIGAGWVDDIRPVPAAVLDRPQLEPEQRALLVRAGRRELACLHLRHLGRAEALAHLTLFVRACRARRLRHCRVIPGKGIDSRAEPVLKRAIIERCRGSALGVLGWAPELDRHGEWGTMVLELRSANR